MFKSIIKDYKNTNKIIKNNHLEQQSRVKNFEQKHKRSLLSMKKKNNEFNDMKERVNKELSRHF